MKTCRFILEKDLRESKSIEFWKEKCPQIYKLLLFLLFNYLDSLPKLYLAIAIAILRKCTVLMVVDWLDAVELSYLMSGSLFVYHLLYVLFYIFYFLLSTYKPGPELFKGCASPLSPLIQSFGGCFIFLGMTPNFLSHL